MWSYFQARFSGGLSCNASRSRLDIFSLRVVRQSPASQKQFDGAQTPTSSNGTKAPPVEDLPQLDTAHCTTKMPLISRLAPELLLQILAYTAGENDWQYQSRLETLSSVNRSWRVFVHGTPSLWASIHSKQTRRQIDNALARSQDHFLCIDFAEDECEDEECDHEEEGCRTLSGLTSQCIRWRSAVISAQSPQSLAPLRRNGAPLLERLDLSVDVAEPEGKAGMELDLFMGQAKRLKELRLSGVGIPWESFILEGLRSLSLCNLSSPPSAEQLLQVLRRCPELVSLQLESFGDEQKTPDSPVPSSSVAEGKQVFLPALKHFGVVDIPAQTTIALFTYIALPRCSSFVINGFSKDAGNNTTLTRHIISTLSSAIRNDDAHDETVQATITVESFDTVISIHSQKTESPLFRLEIRDSAWPAQADTNTNDTSSLYRELTSHLCQLPNTRLELKSSLGSGTASTSRTTAATTINAFASLPRITTLSLGSCWKWDLHEILIDLSRVQRVVPPVPSPSPSPSSPSVACDANHSVSTIAASWSWPCLELRRIELDARQLGDNKRRQELVCEMVRNRLEASRMTTGEGENGEQKKIVPVAVPIPMALQEVEVTASKGVKAEEEVFDQLERMIGKDVKLMRKMRR